MGQPQRLGPEAPHRGPCDKSGRVRPGAPDRGGEEGTARGRHPKQTVRGEEAPTSGGVPAEPLTERGTDPTKLGRAARQGDDRKAELTVKEVEVEHVESADHRPVEQEGSRPSDRAGGPDQTDDLPSAVLAVDANGRRHDRLDVVRGRDDHRCDRRAPVRALERAVVHPHDPRMRFPERTPQG